MAAKIASDIGKPDGLVEVTREGLIDFLRPLEVRKIRGLGKKEGKGGRSRAEGLKAERCFPPGRSFLGGAAGPRRFQHKKGG